MDEQGKRDGGPAATQRKLAPIGSAKPPNIDSRQNERLLKDIAAAHEAWQIALQQFNQAFGDDCVDDAIYLLAAAEMRYESLMRVARRKGLTLDIAGRFVGASKRTDDGEAAVAWPRDVPTVTLGSGPLPDQPSLRGQSTGGASSVRLSSDGLPPNEPRPSGDPAGDAPFDAQT